MEKLFGVLFITIEDRSTRCFGDREFLTSRRSFHRRVFITTEFEFQLSLILLSSTGHNTIYIPDKDYVFVLLDSFFHLTATVSNDGYISHA